MALEGGQGAEGLCEGAHTPPIPTLPDTYVIKLFDRSVDLAQFSENTPLYPICRAWMRNSPSVRERECSPSSPLPPLPEDEEVGWVVDPSPAAWCQGSGWIGLKDPAPKLAG